MRTFKFLLPVILCISTNIAQGQSAPDTTITFKVSGACEQCKQRIQKSMKIKGVHAANWDVATKMLTVSYVPSIISADRIHHTIAGVGHDTEKEKATDKVYKALPDCCHYREMTSEDDMQSSDSTSHADRLSGIVVETRNGQTFPLAGASISWMGTAHGTVSNPHGEFLLHKDGTEDR